MTAAYRVNFEIGLTRFAQAHLDLYVFSIHGDVNLHHGGKWSQMCITR